jgi:ATP-dependent exoDNAse (exonuclease V) beta subunit
MFIHESLDWNDLDSVQEDGKRFYLTPSGKKYPSMTTVLQLMTAQGIAKWRARVGDEVANKISAQASRRGTLMHKLCEDYVNNEEVDTESLMPLDLQNFNALKEQMDKHFGKVYGQEIALYSDFLEMAGRVDCIAEYKGKLSIIDYKTSKKVKKRSNIKNYFMQAAGYAVMFEEIFKKPINNLVILMSVDHEGVVEFVEKRDDHIHDLIELRKKYKEKNNI